MNFNKRVAYFVLPSITDNDGNLVPCIATEGERGYNRTNWHWGKDLAIAEECAAEKNAALGLTSDDVNKIIVSSQVSA